MDRETYIQLDRMEQMIRYIYEKEKEFEEEENQELEEEEKVKTSVKSKKSEIIDEEDEE